MTSPVLIVLFSGEGSHWELATLPFIQKLLHHPIQWNQENVGVIYKLFGIRSIPVHLSHWFGPISASLPLLREFYLALNQLDVFLLCFGMPIITRCYDSDNSTTRAEKHQSFTTWWKVSYYRALARSYPDVGNSSRSTNHLMSRLAGEFWGPLRWLIYAISVSAQHQPPLLSKIFNNYKSL